ncbi:POTRA domain-containing protein [Paraburkholderia sp. BCC1884]|uniref:POTRA domain-containing protein n=1 Tax=Paraburkholderia sp. BCC1884 TaxID=2562668 RepID=UPI0021B15CB6|nr:POTRA domain-containing protein [Paraburkholderia sp. BCC1884]
MKQRLMQCLLGTALLLAAVNAMADNSFNITRFQVDGNSLLPAAEVQRLLAPMTGAHRVYSDIQHALEALENAYRQAGYTTVAAWLTRRPWAR